MRKILNWVIEKWLAGFLTASFFFLLKLYLDLPKESGANFFNFNWVKDILQTQISLYIVMIIIVFLVIVSRIEKSNLKSKYTTKKKLVPEPPHNHYSNYKSDQFGISKLTWTWNYEWQSYNQSFQIVDLKPSCPNCKTPMDLEVGYSYQLGSCHKCRLEGKNSTFQIYENVYDVDKEIIRKITSREVQI